MYLTINIGLFDTALDKDDRCETVELAAKSLILPEDFKRSMDMSQDGGQEASEILEMIALPKQEKVLKKLNKPEDFKSRRYFENRSIIVIAKDGRLAYYKLMGVSGQGIADIVDIVTTQEVHDQEEF
jgi:hypothetical protein